MDEKHGMERPEFHIQKNARRSQRREASKASIKKFDLTISERSGLPRPKTGLDYHTSRRTDTGIDHSLPPMPARGSLSLTATSTAALEKHILLMDLVVRRNKNQHRNQLFFKNLCLLRAAFKRLLECRTVLAELTEESNMPGRMTSEKVRQRFERETTLRGRKEVLEEHIREVLVPKCWVNFTGLVGDSQFANLGVVLVGLVGRIASGDGGLGLPNWRAGEGVRSVGIGTKAAREKRTKQKGSFGGGYVIGTSTRVTGEDQGEVVERSYDPGDAVDMDMLDKDEGLQGLRGDRSISVLHEDQIHMCLAEMLTNSDTNFTSPNDAYPTSTQTAVVQEERNINDKPGKIKSSKKRKEKDAIDDLFSVLL